MTSVVENVAIDCADAYGLAVFWSRVTGRPLDPEARPGDPEARVAQAEGPALYFNEVPEAKKGKNRVHLCLRPDTTRDQEVERLLGLGAAFLADHRNPDGSGWAVLADPEGNEFCVLRGASERAATGMGEAVPGEGGEAALRDAEQRLQAAVRSGDVAALDRLLDDRVVYTGPDGRCLSKPDDLAAHRSRALVVEAFDQEDLQVTVAGTTGVTVVLAALRGVAAGQPFAARLRYTRSWVHAEGAWRVLAAHAGPAPEEA